MSNARATAETARKRARRSRTTLQDAAVREREPLKLFTQLLSDAADGKA
jgi:hypothetical protein